MSRHPLPILATALLLICWSCPPARADADPAATVFTEQGKASFYSNRLVNHKTASGERYRHELKTAAHRKLPFGTMVKVTNLKNGNSVVVRINDRGPFVRGRILDLSRSAFEQIGSTSNGLIRVKIEVVE